MVPVVDIFVHVATGDTEGYLALLSQLLQDKEQRYVAFCIYTHYFSNLGVIIERMFDRIILIRRHACHALVEKRLLVSENVS